MGVGRRSDDDFKAFIADGGDERTLDQYSGGLLLTGAGSQATKTQRKENSSSRLYTTRLAAASRKVLPSATSSRSFSPEISTGISSKISSLGTSPGHRQRIPFYCEAFAYVHETPAEVGRQLFNPDSPFFLLLAGRNTSQASSSQAALPQGS